MHDDGKIDYIDGPADRKPIIANDIRYIGKESNNLDETTLTSLDNDTYLENENLAEFKEWVLSLKSKEVKTLGISECGLRNFKNKIRNGNGLKNKSKITEILLEKYLKAAKIEKNSKIEEICKLSEEQYLTVKLP